MAQPQPEEKRAILSQVLKLVDKLSPEEQLELMRKLQEEHLKLEELRKEVMIGVEQADHGNLIPADEVFREVRARTQERKNAQ